LSVAATIAFAVFSTAQDLPTAIPYFAAIERIVATAQAPGTQFALLAGYNLIYVTPLAALIVFKIMASEDLTQRFFGRVTAAVNWVSAKLLPVLAGVAGIALVVLGLSQVAWA
jgi:cytochrome c biogenesis protein CcdA